jgi:hypothetical protein
MNISAFNPAKTLMRGWSLGETDDDYSAWSNACDDGLPPVLAAHWAKLPLRCSPSYTQWNLVRQRPEKIYCLHYVQSEKESNNTLEACSTDKKRGSSVSTFIKGAFISLCSPGLIVFCLYCSVHGECSLQTLTDTFRLNICSSDRVLHKWHFFGYLVAVLWPMASHWWPMTR